MEKQQAPAAEKKAAKKRLHFPYFIRFIRPAHKEGATPKKLGKIRAVTVFAIVCLLVGALGAVVALSLMEKSFIFKFPDHTGTLAAAAMGQQPAQPEADTAQDEALLEPPPPTPIAWEDAAMEAMIRQALGKTDGQDIFAGDLVSITSLKILGDTHSVVNGTVNSYNSAQGYRVGDTVYTQYGAIASLSDLRHFPSLKKLVIGYNQVEDITALKDLKDLSVLGLYFNRVEDISALAGLENLQYLYLYGNQISDLTPLSGLTKLENLWLGHNAITCLEPVGNLPELRELYVDYNRIQDISPVAGLTSLRFLHAGHNNIRDLSSLQNHPSLTDASFQGNPLGA